MKSKSDIAEKFKVFLAEAKTQRLTVKELLADGGGEFNNKDMTQITEGTGLHHRVTMPYTAKQN